MTTEQNEAEWIPERDSPWYTGVPPAFDPSLPPGQMQWSDLNWEPAPFEKCGYCDRRATMVFHAHDPADSIGFVCPDHMPEDTRESSYLHAWRVHPYQIAGYKPEAIARWRGCKAIGSNTAVE